MNRLIILGNGFDLAHGLKTKYEDYIKNYWSKVTSSNHSDWFLSFENTGTNFPKLENLKDLLDFMTQGSGNTLAPVGNSPHYCFENRKYINISNRFFNKINLRFSKVDWVDIEMEYYQSLKKILLDEIKQDIDSEAFEAEKLKLIRELNDNIKNIAIDFEEYLKKEVLKYIEYSKFREMSDLFLNETIGKIGLKQFFKEFPKNYVDQELKSFYEAKENEFEKFEQTLILNFNYTSTVRNYIKPVNSGSTRVINIHGAVESKRNPINLGFGDERDRFYSQIEDYNQNEYLKYIKSFYYLNTENYKELFDFIEGWPFQTQIMGHSCGLSDRTLLNAIFEHENCKSIKVFYHKFVNSKEDGEEDNYSEIVKNISRHFNKKTEMRSKIVNKTLSQELPQKSRV